MDLCSQFLDLKLKTRSLQPGELLQKPQDPGVDHYSTLCRAPSETFCNHGCPVWIQWGAGDVRLWYNVIVYKARKCSGCLNHIFTIDAVMLEKILINLIIFKIFNNSYV
jgi:hypothetical protein